jgi:SAM-dependent methyltransferase
MPSGYESLRETFNTAASRYHAARPGYPEALFDDLLQIAELGPGSRVLEIGPGTGKATEPLARRGFRIDGIELGPELAEEARNNLAPYPDVNIVVGAFETFDLTPASYDLVMSATAFHWIEQPVGYRRVAEALKPDGRFAEYRHDHVWGAQSADFFEAAQELYLRYDPLTDPNERLLHPDEVETREAEILATGLFNDVQVRRYILDVEHTPESYAALKYTFSDHIARPEPNRTLLTEGLAALIASQPGGKIVKSHLIILHVARLAQR